MEINIPMTRYKRELASIIRRNEPVVYIITRCGKADLVHMPVTMYEERLAELQTLKEEIT